jgi:elongator complex protein 3
MSTQVTESEAFSKTCEDIIERILDGKLSADRIEEAKMEICAIYSSPKVPKNTEILDYAPPEIRGELEQVLRRKPVRTASGVTPVAIMTSPHMCPHGKCLFCPGGPASEFSSPQSYTGHEPAAARGKQTDYDPYGQVTLRLEQFREIGHPVDKAELILMGGTMTARSADYQEWFVRRALEAMNDYDLSIAPSLGGDRKFVQENPQFKYLEDVISVNETADIRCIAMTFETKPDWCNHEQIDRMLRLGGTKVELGVQTTFEHINHAMHRGHGTTESVESNQRLRDSGFKVGFHMMPGQPGMSYDMGIEDFIQLFTDPIWKPDYLKIYPTLVVKGTRTYDMWKRKEYEPLDNEKAARLVAEVKSMIPRYVRLQRVQRDIPANFIEAGVWKSNLRQLALEHMKSIGKSCKCIRCREVGLSSKTPQNLEMEVLEYEAAGGIENFISIEDFDQDILVGFCRLRFSETPARLELKDAGILRELKVYGNEISLIERGEKIGPGEWKNGFQHKGHGKALMEKAEEMTVDAGYSKIAVLAGIGAREYYKQKLGYYQEGPYVSKWLC